MREPRVSGDEPFERAVRELQDIESIKALKARYCRFVDTRQWTELAALFTPDAHYELPMGPISSPADFVDQLAGIFRANALSVHQCHLPEIELLDEGHARGTWQMHDYVDRDADYGRRVIHGYGYYQEEYRLVDQTWRISAIRLSRIRVDPGLPLVPQA
jgi:hypothetical protein